MTKGKKLVWHHDIWEEVLWIIRSIPPVTVMHVYGRNKIVYNEAADELAKAGAAQSKIHRPVRPRRAPDDGPRGGRQKHTRGRGPKRRVSVQVSDDSTCTCSDGSVVICQRRRRMRNAPGATGPGTGIDSR